VDQDATWYGGRPRPRPHCVIWRLSSPPTKGGTAATPIFGPCVLWPKGWVDQDATSYGGGPRPRRHCVRWGPRSPSQKGHSPQFSAHVCCGQTAGWINMPLGMEVDLGPGHTVLDGDSSPLPKGAQQPPPLFGPCLLWPNGRPSELLLSTCLNLSEL